MAEKSIKKNAFFNVIKTIMGLLFPLITFPYASRILLPEGIGKVNFANSIVSYFSVLAALGIGTYGTREAAKVRHNKFMLSQFTAELFTLNLISTVISYILLFVSIFVIPKLQSYRLLLFTCSSTIIFSTVGISWLYSALEEYGYIALRSVVFQVLSLVFLFVFVRTPDDYVAYAAMGVFSSVGSNICNLVHARKYLDFRDVGKLQLRRHIKPVFILFGSSLAISVFTILDTSMLGFMSTDTEVGYYTAATKLTRMIRDLFPAVFTVMFARLSVYASNENDSEKFKGLVYNMLNFTLCMALPIITGLFLLGEPVIVLLSGNAYIPALPTMYAMTPVILFSSVAGFLGGSVLNSMCKEKTYLYCVVAGAIINSSANFILIPRIGALGAGIATVATEFLLMLLYIILTRDIIPFKKLGLPFLQYIVATIVMGIILFFIKDYLFSGFAQIILTTLLGMTIYFATLLILRNELIGTFCKNLFSKIHRSPKK